ncbi:hypothetical protein LWI29_002626 [Acer saccharum]|uniref:Pentatricopeptide repeat-containing protein n=1 Tax=Acer saccharum TaxID=4024 RepID=A0AA39VHL3_ACESA|nr:hypothetical protein LWI29_002626 [Acer saccharum]
MRSLKDGLIYHVQSIKAGFRPPTHAVNQLIHLYSKHHLLRESQKLFDEMPERNVFTWNTIISAYIKSQNLTQARALFDSAPDKDVVTYNSMLSGYIGADGFESHALELLREMQNAGGGVKFDEFTVTRMLNLCAKLSHLVYGRQLHAFMAKTGNDVSRFAVSSLIDMYSKCSCFGEVCMVFDGNGEGVDLVSKNALVAACCREGEMDMALKIFWREPELNDAVSWNTLISGYVQNGQMEEGLKLFVCMVENGVRWNEHTFGSVLSACSGLRSLKHGKEVHTWVLKNGMSSNSFISSGIVDVYCKCENMKYAERMHLVSGSGNSFSVTSMIVGYSYQGKMVEARKLFDSLAEKNRVVWTALFSGYVKAQQCEAVLELLSEFRAKEGLVPDAVMLISVLGACALQAALNPGKEIHAYMLRIGVEMDEKLISTMVDMYSKCGNMTYAEKIFQHVFDRDSILYNVMIAGYAHHGHGTKAIRLFEEMVEKGFKPDTVTFIALLSACRHCGSVEMGEKYFKSMTEDYNILPERDHYGCMIDLYGRANQLEKAVEFMRRIPIELDAVILGAYLNACRLNRNAKLAKEAEEKLLRLEGDNGARYVQLANVYAAEGNWDETRRIRNQMRGNVKKFAGCSWLYLKSGIHTFISSDTSHSKTKAIYLMLDSLTIELYEIARAFD